jgi:hypothetical protein
MKKIGITILLITILLQAFSQEVRSKEKQEKKETVTAVDSNAATRVIIGDNLLRFEDSKDALRFRIANRGVEILETLEGPKLKFEKYTEDDDNVYDNRSYERGDWHSRHSGRFRGHWSGIEFGFNNYLTENGSTVMPADINYMTLHSGKSHNFNLNFTQQSFGITRFMGFVTGLGINWNNYRFDGDNNILKLPDGVIGVFDPGEQMEKTKLTTVYLTCPLLFELQIPSYSHHLNFAGGFIGAVKIGSHTKIIYEDGRKEKSSGDFSLNILRIGPTARIGFENFQIYGTYYMTPLFKAGKEPGGHKLYPFEIGIAFTFNS